jgi:hypothetical protein
MLYFAFHPFHTQGAEFTDMGVWNEYVLSDMEIPDACASCLFFTFRFWDFQVVLYQYGVRFCVYGERGIQGINEIHRLRTDEILWDEMMID